MKAAPLQHLQVATCDWHKKNEEDKDKIMTEQAEVYIDP